MPLVGHNQQNIQMRVNNRIIGNTVFGQMAHYRGLVHRQDEGRPDTVQIMLEVFYHAVDDQDQLLGRINTRGIAPYRMSLMADNESIVDAATGEILRVRNGESQEEWEAIANGFEQGVDFQGNFFNKVAFSVPVLIAPMILHHIQNANLFGRFEQ